MSLWLRVSTYIYRVILNKARRPTSLCNVCVLVLSYVCTLFTLYSPQSCLFLTLSPSLGDFSSLQGVYFLPFCSWWWSRDKRWLRVYVHVPSISTQNECGKRIKPFDASLGVIGNSKVGRQELFKRSFLLSAQQITARTRQSRDARGTK